MPRNTTSLEERPVFICGHVRTGTSLLLSLLDGHPELVVASHESKFFLTFLPKAHTAEGEAKRRLAEETLFLVWRPGGYHEKFLSHIPIEDVFKSFRARLADSPGRDADYLTCSVLAYGEASGQISERSRRWVEKTPFTEQYTDFIFSTWDDAKCIHLTRDPRDLLYTSRRRDRYHRRRVTPLGAIAHAWQKSARWCRQNRETYGEDRYLEIRYEDLVRSPEGELPRILDFLEVDDHEIVRSPTRGAGEIGWQGNAVGRRFSGIDASQVDRWKELDPWRIRVLEAILADEMKLHGYTREYPPSLSARVVAGGWNLLNSLRPALAWLRP